MTFFSFWLNYWNAVLNVTDYSRYDDHHDRRNDIFEYSLDWSKQNAVWIIQMGILHSVAPSTKAYNSSSIDDSNRCVELHFQGDSSSILLICLSPTCHTINWVGLIHLNQFIIQWNINKGKLLPKMIKKNTEGIYRKTGKSMKRKKSIKIDQKILETRSNWITCITSFFHNTTNFYSTQQYDHVYFGFDYGLNCVGHTLVQPWKVSKIHTRKYEMN